MPLDKSIKIVAGVLAVIIPLSGFVAWLTAIQINGKNNTVSVESIEEKIDVMASDVSRMKTDVALIKQAVGAGRETASAGSITP